MNRSLARIHFGLSIFYGIGAALLCVIYLAGGNASGSGVLILAGIFGTPFVLHCAALRGVRSGHLWGRNLSRTLGILLLFALVAAACGRKVGASPTQVAPAPSATTPAGLETAILAGGCFWGMQEIIRKIPGVVSTDVG